MKRTIQVTQQHIDRGKKANCTQCPIALALAETLKCQVDVNTSIIGVRLNQQWFYHVTPERATIFIWLYDSIRQRKLAPFSFDLDDDDWWSVANNAQFKDFIEMV